MKSLSKLTLDCVLWKGGEKKDNKNLNQRQCAAVLVPVEK